MHPSSDANSALQVDQSDEELLQIFDDPQLARAAKGGVLTADSIDAEELEALGLGESFFSAPTSARCSPRAIRRRKSRQRIERATRRAQRGKKKRKKR